MTYFKNRERSNLGGQLVNQLPAPALGHAAHESKQGLRATAPEAGGDIFHFPEGFLFGLVSDTASVEQDDIRGVFGWGEGIAFGDELGCDRQTAANAQRWKQFGKPVIVGEHGNRASQAEL